ncbi:hypothetical protein QUF80_00075 [Desulfococcaceae bacterium HSG8]|nr:hypothetical protein [Desulfococcaceae bacterium HSG8]
MTQLRSLGFEILYFDYDTIIEAFSACGIDAFFDEDTSDKSVRKRIDLYNSLSDVEIEKIESRIREIKQDEINKFIGSLERTILRSIEKIIIVALHGKEYQANKIQDAIKYIEKYKSTKNSVKFVKFEIFVRYNNGDKVDASFQDKVSAVNFLKLF